MRFTKNSPIVLEIKRILYDNSKGMLPGEIRRALLQCGRQGVLDNDITEIFSLEDFRRLPDGRYILSEIEPDKDLGDEDNVTVEQSKPSTLTEISNLDNFVIFDLETTGLDPQTDDFFQIGALKVINDNPVSPIQNWYAHIDKQIPLSLQRKLYFQEMGLTPKIRESNPPTQVLKEFIKFADGLPLIAHNATYDYSIITRIDSSINNQLLDSLELFCIAFPQLTSHSLENLAIHFGYTDGIKADELDKLSSELKLAESLGLNLTEETPKKELFHSAPYDCMVLYVLLKEAINALRGLGNIKRELFLLSPSISSLIGYYPGPSPKVPSSLSDIINLRKWPLPNVSARVASPDIEFNEDAVKSYYKTYLSIKSRSEREPQKIMISSVVSALSNGRKMMVEGPTGTGKTLAYLIPTILYTRASGKQILISTNVKNLQSQLVKELDEISNTKIIDFNFAMLKGRDNYLCLRRLFEGYIEAMYGENNADISFEEKLALIYMLRFAEESSDGDLENTSFWFENRFPVMRSVKDRIKPNKETCYGKSCLYYESCFFYQAQSKAKEADIIVINHSLLLQKNWSPEEYEIDGVIIDEAHNLEDAATNALTEESSRAEIERLLGRLLSPNGKRGLLVRILSEIKDNAEEKRKLVSGLMMDCRRLRSRILEFGAHLKAFLQRQGVRFHHLYGATFRLVGNPENTTPLGWQDVKTALRDLFSEWDKLGESLQNLISGLSDIENCKSLVKELKSVQSGLMAGVDTPGQRILIQDILNVNFDPMKVVHWIELSIESSQDNQANDNEVLDKDIYWAVKRAPVRIGNYLKGKIYENIPAVILTSATLTTADSGFGFFADRLGLEEYVQDAENSLVQIGSEFRYDEKALLAMPGYMRSNASYDQLERFKEEVKDELGIFFKFTDGKGLGLYTARDRMEYTANELEKPLGEFGIPLYWQRRDASKKVLKEEFEQRTESVLLGLKSFWEGVDVPGTSLSYVVIEKLPFPSLGDPVTKARCEEIVNKGGRDFSEYVLPLATIQFKQGFGRLIRNKDDIGVVMFLDKRLRAGCSYRDVVLNSLPGFKRTDDIIEAEENRFQLYRKIADHVANSEAAIDFDAKLQAIPEIRQAALTDLEKLLRELEIPNLIPVDEYDKYRERILFASMELFGFANFRVPEQEAAIRTILAGNDVLVVLPTGSGKSFTFQITALLRKGTTIVFSPLIALMKDQVDNLKERGLHVVDYVMSGQSAGDREDVYRRMMNGQLKLIYISPERIRDPALQGVISRTDVRQIVVDEAHCVYMWGANFRPDFLKIPTLFGDKDTRPPIAALTATATKETRKAIAELLSLRDGYAFITRSVDRPELKFIVCNDSSPVDRVRSKSDKLRVLTKILRAADQRNENAIIYTSTVREAENLANILNLSGFSVRYYHGRMGSQQRRDVQEQFLEGMINIIVATKAFGMGIDKKDIRYVIHYDIPGDLESYFQEVGRAGRDGSDSYGVLLYHKSDLNVQKYFIQKSFPDYNELNDLLSVLRRQMDGDIILVNPYELASEIEMNVEILDVAFHLLETDGFIERLHNFTLNGSLLLNFSKEKVLDAIPNEYREMLAKAFDSCKASNNRGVNINLLEIARSESLDPMVLDRILSDLSSQGKIVYRAWDRGYALKALDKMRSEKLVQKESPLVKTVRKRQMQDLRKMIHYAENLGSGSCRRQYVLKHFEDSLNEPDPACCDLCHPNMYLPWRDMPSEEVGDISSFTDPSYITLRAVEWNESLKSLKYSNPYGKSNLVKILIGNSYEQLRDGIDMKDLQRRKRKLESSPFFGILRTIPGGQKRIGEIIDKLAQLEYIGFEKQEFTTDSGMTEYMAPVLKPKGSEQIQEGKYLWIG